MKILRCIAFAILLPVCLLGIYFFISNAMMEHNLAFIVPALVFTFLTAVLIYLFLLETFIGYKTFLYENENIIVKRKNRTIAVIPKQQIQKLTLVYDVARHHLDNKDEIHFFAFQFQKKRYCVDVNRFGEDNLLSLAKDLEYKTDSNILYYFLLLLT